MPQCNPVTSSHLSYIGDLCFGWLVALNGMLSPERLMLWHKRVRRQQEQPKHLLGTSFPAFHDEELLYRMHVGWLMAWVGLM